MNQNLLQSVSLTWWFHYTKCRTCIASADLRHRINVEIWSEQATVWNSCTNFLCINTLGIHCILSFFLSPLLQCHPTPSHTLLLEVCDNLLLNLQHSHMTLAWPLGSFWTIRLVVFLAVSCLSGERRYDASGLMTAHESWISSKWFDWVNTCVKRRINNDSACIV